GFSDPLAPVPTAFGELLVDINSSGLLTDIGFFIGGTATHSVDVPNDSSLGGLEIYCQNFLNGTSQLTNRIELVLGS
ncbi:MAG: hypothetical protein ACI82F_004393, partial [Planctomycetota bacterium]